MFYFIIIDKIIFSIHILNKVKDLYFSISNNKNNEIVYILEAEKTFLLER